MLRYSKVQNERLELSRTVWKTVMLPITSILLSCGLTSSHTPLALNHKLRSCGRVSKNHNDTITSRWFSRQGHIRTRTEFSGLQIQYITCYVLRPKADGLGIEPSHGDLESLSPPWNITACKSPFFYRKRLGIKTGYVG